MQPSLKLGIYDCWPTMSSWWFCSAFKQSVRMDAGVDAFAGSTLTGFYKPTSPLPRTHLETTFYQSALIRPWDRKASLAMRYSTLRCFLWSKEAQASSAQPCGNVDRTESNVSESSPLGSDSGRLGLPRFKWGGIVSAVSPFSMRNRRQLRMSRASKVAAIRRPTFGCKWRWPLLPNAGI
jgi:hypothetical protein